MSKKPKFKHIGGWPKIITIEPPRPHEDADILLGTGGEKSDGTDEPFDVNRGLSNAYESDQNIYAVLEVFVEFHSRGLYPPPWALDDLAECFRVHLEDPDPDLLASQMGISGYGSGTTNPYHVYTKGKERRNNLTEVWILLSGFKIGVLEAARIVIQKEGLEISEKTLANNLREWMGDPKRIMLKHRAYAPVNDPFLGDAELRDEYLTEFPSAIRDRLIKKAPDLT